MSSQPYAARPSPLYRFALGAVAVTMAILPGCYVALTALAGYGVYFFATRCFADVWEWPLGSAVPVIWLKVVCSCTPLVVGGAVVVAMVKPLFAPRGRAMQPLALNPAHEPRVYALVKEVCAILGVVAPKRIDLICDLNAGAMLQGGWRGFFGGQRILRLGMPLLAGLSQRELAGVLAHELGHCRQKMGTRVSFLIRSVNAWFFRAVYVRDAWDEWLEGLDTQTWWVAFMIGCARGGVAFSRRALWLLMMLGHATSAALMRQMEYDADRCQIRVAGSGALETAMLKFAALQVAYDDAHAEMFRIWKTRYRLPDNLPLLVGLRAEGLDAARRQEHENLVGLKKSSWFDTHPSDADRVRHARLLAEPGYEISDAPARDLFDSFAGLGRLVTLAHYQDDLNVPVTPGFIVPLETWLDIEEKARPVSPVAEEPSAPAPTAAEVRATLPRLKFDPSKFEGKGPSMVSKS